jgi:hypothetical protein
MSLLPGAKRAEHQKSRWDRDFYIEPEWCSDALLAAAPFKGPIHDPACGEGRIVIAAKRAGYAATRRDIADRGFGDAEIIDFLKDGRPRGTLVFNAPYEANEPFIEHAQIVAQHSVAALVRVPFLCGQERYRNIYSRHPPALVLPFARPPSMPPGGTDIPTKGGTTDYCWLVWHIGYQGPSRMQWLAP